MVSRKSERLVNLVIALLATKRYLTKSEIFRTIEGYEGSNDSMERMFERDKDELRSLGIDIEVSSLDPLFDDEIGYRIRSENFVMNYSQLTPSEIAYMSLGAQVWKDAILSEVAQKALRKLIGLAKPADITEIPTFAPTVLNAPNFLSELVECISSRRPIEFTYIDGELNANKRNINVYSYFSLKGFWYFSGYDLAKSDIRTFRCDRVTGDIHLSKKTQCYDIPDDYVTDFNFQVLDQSQNAQLRIRHGRGTQLRSIATKIEHGEEFDLIDLSFASDDSLVPIILWHLDDVVVVNPDSLKQSVVASLRNLATSHG
jgi:proteasome accessory factor B